MSANGGLRQKNGRLAGILVLVVVGMFGFGYALVPLYDVLCDLTGLNGRFKNAASPTAGAAAAGDGAETAYAADKNRIVKVEFITSLNENTPMRFQAETVSLRVNPGILYTVNFVAENRTGRSMTAQAIPSFSPGAAADYFKKIECFCFNSQTFKPYERRRLPMRFVIDPALPAQYQIITLAYTFFDNTKS